MKKWKRTLALLAVLSVLGGISSFADEAYDGTNSSYPMIANTGGIYNDGSQGLFISLQSVKIKNLFDDGMEVDADILNANGEGTVITQTAAFRLAVNGRSFVKKSEDLWMEINPDSDDPMGQAVYYIKKQLGDPAYRDRYLEEINAIKAANGNEPLGTVVPSNVKPYDGSDLFAPSVKKKGNVIPASKADSDRVQVNITANPVVEITKNDVNG
jgi:hypothetical protein